MATPETESERAAAEKYPRAVTAVVSVKKPSIDDDHAMRIFQREWRTPDKRERELFGRYEPRIREVFEAGQEITAFYACHNIYAGLVLTSKNELLITWDVGQFPSADPLLQSCYRLANRASEYVSGAAEKLAHQMIFDTANILLGALDNLAQDKPGRTEVFTQPLPVFDLIEQDLGEIEAFIDRNAQRLSQAYYVLGMTLSLLVVIATALLAPLEKVTTTGFRVGPFLAALLAGGVGAWISVIRRLTRDREELDYEAHNGTLFAFGVARPVIGAVFGVVFYMMVAGGVLAISGPDGGIEEVYFFAIVGFLAGFSERFAKDVLHQAESALLPASEEEKHEAKRRKKSPLEDSETSQPT